jgi:hypothetical protein
MMTRVAVRLDQELTVSRVRIEVSLRRLNHRPVGNLTQALAGVSAGIIVSVVRSNARPLRRAVAGRTWTRALRSADVRRSLRRLDRESEELSPRYAARCVGSRLPEIPRALSRKVYSSRRPQRFPGRLRILCLRCRSIWRIADDIGGLRGRHGTSSWWHSKCKPGFVRR